MKRAYERYIDSEGYIHASGAVIAVNSGLCGNNDPIDETDDAVTCAVCLAVDAHVRKHAALHPVDSRAQGGEK